MAAHSAALISTEELARRLGAPGAAHLRLHDLSASPGPTAATSPKAVAPTTTRATFPARPSSTSQAELSDKNSKLRFTLPSLDELTKAFAAKGVGHGTFVVLYSHASPVWATRIWWMLRAVGFDDVAILDGGLDKWKAEEPPARRPRPRPIRRRRSRCAAGPRSSSTRTTIKGAIGKSRHADAQCAQPRPAQGHAAA